MTDVLSRPEIVDTEPPPPPPPPTAASAPPRAEPDAGGGTAAVVLAALSAAAGAIHLAMAPSHLAASAVEGTGFLVAGWAQVGLAVELIRGGPLRRWALGAVAGLNAALIALWALSRTAGLPAGAHAGRPARVTVVDATAVVFELALVAGALVLLWRPRAAARTSPVAALAIPAVVVALATAVVVSPAARDHAAGSHAAGHSGHAGHATATPLDDKGFSLLANGHQHASGPDVALDAATRARLDGQLAVTRELIAKYPTVAAAYAAGYRRYGAFTPGLGAHYVLPSATANVTGAIDRDELLHPVLLFDGSDPAAPLAGFMYISAFGATAEPEGFAGPNDHWHFHETVCLRPLADGTNDAPFGADQEVTPAMCDEVGGTWMGLTQYMVHVWTAPGYANRYGVFYEDNPHLDCADGTYHQISWRDMGHRTTTCVKG